MNLSLSKTNVCIIKMNLFATPIGIAKRMRVRKCSRYYPRNQVFENSVINSYTLFQNRSISDKLTIFD